MFIWHGLHTPDGVDTHENITDELHLNECKENREQKKKNITFRLVVLVLHAFLPLSQYNADPKYNFQLLIFMLSC